MFDRHMPAFEKFIYFLVLYSVGMFFVEAHMGGENSLRGPIFFLWSERFVAFVLTTEVFLRFWFHSPHTEQGTHEGYFKSPEMAIDLIAVVPFWAGFFVGPEYLAAVRSMRILRLLKFYRASPVAHKVVNSLLLQRLKLRLVFSFVGIMVLFSGTIMHEIEKIAQPDTFGSLWNSIWWAVVTLTTVGYGDMFPVTKAGQLIAIGLILSGIGVIGALFSIVGSAFDVSEE